LRVFMIRMPLLRVVRDACEYAELVTWRTIVKTALI
jgi:hypothetical protein